MLKVFFVRFINWIDEVIMITSSMNSRQAGCLVLSSDVTSALRPSTSSSGDEQKQCPCHLVGFFPYHSPSATFSWAFIVFPVLPFILWSVAGVWLKRLNSRSSKLSISSPLSLCSEQNELRGLEHCGVPPGSGPLLSIANILLRHNNHCFVLLPYFIHTLS